jgi:hypothetical protein
MLSDQDVWTLGLRIKRSIEWLELRYAFSAVGRGAVIELTGVPE